MNKTDTDPVLAKGKRHRTTLGFNIDYKNPLENNKFINPSKCVSHLSLSCTAFFNSLFFVFFSSSSPSSSSDTETSPLSSLSEAEPLPSLPLPLSEPLAESDSGKEKKIWSEGKYFIKTVLQVWDTNFCSYFFFYLLMLQAHF